MADYIERKAALHAVNEFFHDPKVDVALNAVPSANVREDVQGEWETNSDRPDTLICSVCGVGYDVWKHDPHNFCPYCGAQMAGGGER